MYNSVSVQRRQYIVNVCKDRNDDWYVYDEMPTIAECAVCCIYVQASYL